MKAHRSIYSNADGKEFLDERGIDLTHIRMLQMVDTGHRRRVPWSEFDASDMMRDLPGHVHALIDHKWLVLDGDDIVLTAAGEALLVEWRRFCRKHGFALGEFQWREEFERLRMRSQRWIPD